MKSELIYTEDGVLNIQKPNGLRYIFENCDAPELGFEYDVLVYADIEQALPSNRPHTVSLAFLI